MLRTWGGPKILFLFRAKLRPHPNPAPAPHPPITSFTVIDVSVLRVFLGLISETNLHVKYF